MVLTMIVLNSSVRTLPQTNEDYETGFNLTYVGPISPLSSNFQVLEKSLVEYEVMSQINSTSYAIVLWFGIGAVYIIPLTKAINARSANTQ